MPDRPTSHAEQPVLRASGPAPTYDAAVERTRRQPPSPRRLGALAVCAGVLLAGCSGEEQRASQTPPANGLTPSPSPTVSIQSPAPDPSASGTTAQPSETEAAPTVGELYRDTRTSALAAGSGHAVGTQTRGGRTLRIDVEGVANGSNQRVAITVPGGGTSEVITEGGRYWLGGDEAFWVEQTGDANAGRDMVGKYVEISESDATELGSFTLRSILTEKFGLAQFAALEGVGTPAQRTTLKGKDAYLLTGRDGARLWVATDGSGQLLRAVGPKGAPSDLTFSGWERARTWQAPPAGSVVEG